MSETIIGVVHQYKNEETSWDEECPSKTKLGTPFITLAISKKEAGEGITSWGTNRVDILRAFNIELSQWDKKNNGKERVFRSLPTWTEKYLYEDISFDSPIPGMVSYKQVKVYSIHTRVAWE